MGDELRRTIYHAAIGSTVGTLVAVVSQEASNMMSAQLVSMGGPPTTNALLSGVVAGSITAVAILAGDKIINMITPLDDPLFRVFY